MISYQSFSYFYFLFFCIALAWIGKSFISKKNLIFSLNLCFHLMFFFFNKKQFIVLQVALLGTYISAFWLSTSENKKSNSALLVTLSTLFFVQIKYSVFQFNFLHDISQIISFVGLSFFTFRAISLFVDLKRGAIKKSIKFIDCYNFLTFFPLFLSGPLDRYEHFVEETEKNTVNSLKDQFDNIFRIVLGAFKKIVVADYLMSLSINTMYVPDLYKLPFYKVMVSMYIYSFVLYFDFSGYSDMAIGIGGLLGVKVPENFENPFTAKNIQEFWNKWHISFMHWLRDYIYYPIQMFLVKNFKLKNMVLVSSVGFFITFLLAGLWHGDKINYLCYGTYHGLAFGVFFVWKNYIQKKTSESFRKFYNSSKVIKYFSIILTYHYFIFGLFFFTDTYKYFLNIFGAN